MNDLNVTRQILLVDDVPAVLAQEAEIIKKLGLPVITANDGKSALKMVIAEKPVIVFLDLVMPDMQGDAICKFIKARPDLSDVSVIMLTGRDNQDDFQRCFQSGCDAYITKPLDLEEVIDKVNIVLGEKGIYLDEEE